MFPTQALGRLRPSDDERRDRHSALSLAGAARLSMRVRADQRKCQAYANCVLAAPDVFDLDDASGKVIVVVETPADERRAAVQEAVRNCPTQAITLDAETPHLA